MSNHPDTDLTTAPTQQGPVGLAKLLKGLLILNIVLFIIDAVISFNEIRLIQSLSSLSENELAEQILNYQTQFSTYDSLNTLIYIITSVLILTWLYQAKAQSLRLGAQDTRFTPFSSIIWYFVPIACLWKPFQAMKELYRSSVNPQNWQNTASSGWINVWWLFYLLPLAGIVPLWPTLKTMVINPDVLTFKDVINLDQYLIFCSLLNIICLVALTILVHKISSAQTIEKV